MNRRKVTSTGLVLTSVLVITIHHSRANAPVRFHCQGMAGGHQKDGLSFDGPLNNDLVYDAARESISREQNGELVGSWHVTVDGGVLRWTSNEITKEFFDIDGLAYGFDVKTKDGEGYGTASCTRSPSANRTNDRTQ